MEMIHLDINTDRHQFILTGATDKVKKNRRAKFYFEDYINANFLNDGTIIIPYKEEDKESTLKKIKKSLDKYGIEQNDSNEIKSALNYYYKERENFKEFSKKAKGIWNNDLNVDEFKTFHDSLEKHLPNRRLYDKQMLAAFHLAFSQNACNFSVPGAGKTSVVYGAYAFLKNLNSNYHKHVNKLLIIGPLSSFGPWEDEYESCFGKKPTSKRLSGGVKKDERDRHLLSIEPAHQTPELTLMSYQSVSYNLESLTHFLQKQDNKVMVVLDEAHKIKNIDGGVWSSSILSLAKYCRARVVLTGTPVPNGYEDIYNLYEFIWPDKNVINFNVYQLKNMSSNIYDARIEKLVDNISPFFIRIKKKDLGLPPTQEHKPTIVQMGEVQREIYDFIENKYIGYFEENEKYLSASSELAKARFIRLMQAATNPNLLKEPLEQYYVEQGLTNELCLDDTNIVEKILKYRELESVPKKFEIVRSKIEALIEQNEKVIVWGTFVKNLKDLSEYLSNNGIDSRLLIGEVPVERDDLPKEIETREKIIHKFHDKNSTFKVIIANPFAVAESISLHKACHNAIYLERTFNASNFIQSKDRIHRVGLNDEIITHYHYLVAENSIDETIHNRLLEKEKRMLELIESQDIPLISENMNYDVDLKDDVKAIIRDYVRRSIHS
jgi:hypothetical protein